MKLVEKVITGYATTYTTAKQYSSSYPWSNVPNAFDWSPSNTDWRNTYASAKIHWSTGSSYEWYLDGIGTFKSFLDDNLDDAYGKTGYEYTNFSCIPDGSELTAISFLVRSSVAKYNTETIKYYKNGTDVTIGSSGSVSSYIYKKATSSVIQATENTVSEGTISTNIGQTFQRDSSNKFIWTGNTACNIGSWSLSDFKNGLFKARVRCKSNSSAADTAYWYPYGFTVKLYCNIPQYEIKVSTTDPKAGTVTGSGDYFPGRIVTVTATPNQGYKFKRWRLNGEDTEFTATSVSFEAGFDANIEAVFEQDAYIMYDTVFSYKKWYDAGITSSSCEVSDITEEGFTLKSLDSGNDGYTNESPKCEVKPNTRYRVDIDCEGTGWQIFVFFHPADSTTWNSHFNTSSSGGIFETPDDCKYISIRIDANTYGNTVRVSNIRIYPAEYEYMSNTVATAQRSDKLQLSLPDRVVRHGYLFDGWNTEIDGSGTKYEEGTAFPKESVILYSQWLLPIMFRGKFAKSLLKDGKTIDYMQMNNKVFPENPLYVPVKFLNYDGSLIKEKSVLFGHKVATNDIPIPSRPSDNTKDYYFSHWGGNLNKVQSIQDSVAQYTSSTRYYTIRFGYYDYYNNFIVLGIQQLQYMENPTVPDATRSSELIDNIFYYYDFLGWDKQIDPVTSDVDYVALYNVTEVPACSVTWLVGNDKIIENCPLGTEPIPPYEEGSNVSINGIPCILTGWNPSITPITGNTTYSAVAQGSITARVSKYGYNCEDDGGTISAFDDIGNFMSATGPMKKSGGIYAYTVLYGMDFNALSGLSNISIENFSLNLDLERNSVVSSASTTINFCMVTDFGIGNTAESVSQYTDLGDGKITVVSNSKSYSRRTVKYTKTELPNTFEWMNDNVDKVISGYNSNTFGIRLWANSTNCYDVYMTIDFKTG